jgi:hypothetical protein
MFCRIWRIFRSWVEPIQDREDTINLDQRLITVAEAFKALSTLLAVL